MDLRESESNLFLFGIWLLKSLMLPLQRELNYWSCQMFTLLQSSVVGFPYSTCKENYWKDEPTGEFKRSLRFVLFARGSGTKVSVCGDQAGGWHNLRDIPAERMRSIGSQETGMCRVPESLTIGMGQDSLGRIRASGTVSREQIPWTTGWLQNQDESPGNCEEYKHKDLDTKRKEEEAFTRAEKKG